MGRSTPIRQSDRDRIVEVSRNGFTRKIKKGVCGSKHIITSGFIYSPKAEGRRKMWIGLDAFDQSNWYAGDESNYVRENAQAHKTRIEIIKDNELISTYDLQGKAKGRGIQYIDINTAGYYSIIVSNLETGECSGGKCEEGSTTYTDTMLEALWGSYDEREINNCWYRQVIDSFEIDEDEIEAVRGTEEMPPDIMSLIIDWENAKQDDDEYTDEDIFLFGGLLLSAIILTIGMFKS